MHTTSRLLKGLIVATALLSAPCVYADTSATTPEMTKALAKAAQGPDQLRWFIQRTRTIYALYYNDVKARFEQTKVASQDTSPVLTKAETK